MLKIAILDDYQNAAFAAADWDSLPDADVSVFNKYIADEDDLVETLRPFDVIVAMRERTPFPASLLQQLPELKLLITTGTRNLAIDMDFASKRNIPVCGTSMVPHSTYEHAWALILALAKNIPQENALMHAGGWQAEVSIGLKGKTLGILGLGRLGAEVARIGQAFGMQVIAWSQNLTEEKAAEHKVLYVDKETLFRDADILSIHLLLSDRTRGLVGTKELSAMKKSAYLVNTARGPIVDEAALLASLRARQIAGAAIDVYDVEPLSSDHPFRELDNLLMTGHTGYVVQELYELAYGQAVENIKAWLSGNPQRVLNA
ncbi:D-2-hydroxyacid dehydrogenase family protein [Haliea sp. AH-315-K21]|uniref:Hydroxyacid dehydrogenase n=1 Tax=SAR86 cluster bacterium TaxID=2030880 RepID=A0A2A5C9F0_9GAMM|nr:D-2-hydroxyacid dehydrogenase family protein [Haliea sp. AH-315-K21]PCJ39996.1 MAG: hydroxyacid dehydrogenase [SAR86 cluster bacterium]